MRQSKYSGRISLQNNSMGDEELECAYYHVREQFKAWRNRDSACYAP